MEFSVDVGEGSFAEITEASKNMINTLEEPCNLDFSDSLVGMEIPPVNGFYAVKLWALDSRVYDYIKSYAAKVWLFNVPYLKFINGKANSKKDTMKMIDDIVEAFEFEGYEVIQTVANKKGKPKKLTSNQCDSFLYCVRVFVRYSLENGINAELVQDILNINEKFSIEKETENGKSKKKEK